MYMYVSVDPVVAVAYHLWCGANPRSGSAQLAKAMPWPPTVPAESFLRGSSLPLAGMTGVNSAQQLRAASTSAAVATTCAGRLFSWGFQCAVWPL